MNKTDLIAAVAEKTSLSKAAAEAAVNAVLDQITNTLSAGSSVAIIGFGTFQVSERAARTGRNPKTGESIQIAASKSASFKPGKALKESLNT